MANDTEDQSQKTEQPTEHRLSKAREKGQFAISKEVSHGIMLTVFAFCLFLIFPPSLRKLFTEMQNFMEDGLSQSSSPKELHHLVLELAQDTALVLLLPAGLIFAGAFLASISQTQFKVSLESIKPKMDKFSLSKGLKKIFGLKNLGDFIKSLIKFLVAASVIVLVMKSNFLSLVHAPEWEPTKQIDLFMTFLWRLFVWLLPVIFLLALLDFFYEQWSHLRGLRMSKKEIKDEQKEMEGDPHIKGRLRQIRTERARRRMAAEVPKATVVVTNPTHYAVALYYALGSSKAPVVLVKGVDYLALRMRDIAREHGVPTVENPPLARGLYQRVKEGEEIPKEDYEAVAHIIRYVYGLHRKRSRPGSS